MIISAGVVVLLQSYIQYDLSILAIVILSFMIFSYVIGEVITSIADEKIKKRNQLYELNPKLGFKVFSFVIVLFDLILQYKFIREVGDAYGASDLLSSYAANRLNTVDLQKTGETLISPPAYLNIISFLASSVEIICLHIMLLDKLKFKKKVDKLLLATVIMYSLTLFFNSGRTAFVFFLIQLFYISSRLSNMALGTLLKSNKILLSILGIFFFTLFLVLGNLREKSAIKGDINIELDGNSIIAIYVGGPLVGFDIYANKGIPPYDFKGLTRNEYFGKNTFKGVYDILRKVGIDFKRPVLHEEKYYLKVIEGNVYTGFCYFIRDFGLYGSILFMFILGAAIGHFDELIERNVIGYDNIIGYYTMSYVFYSLLAMFYTSVFYYLFSVDFIIFKVFMMHIFIKFGVRRSLVK